MFFFHWLREKKPFGTFVTVGLKARLKHLKKMISIPTKLISNKLFKDHT